MKSLYRSRIAENVSVARYSTRNRHSYVPCIQSATNRHHSKKSLKLFETPRSPQVRGRNLALLNHVLSCVRVAEDCRRILLSQIEPHIPGPSNDSDLRMPSVRREIPGSRLYEFWVPKPRDRGPRSLPMFWTPPGDDSDEDSFSSSGSSCFEARGLGVHFRHF